MNRQILAKVSGVQKLLFAIAIGLGTLILIFGNSIGTSCLCPEGVECLCPDDGLIYRIAGAILAVAGIGLWAFQAFRKVKIVN
jgi:hypothetical protein